MIIKRHLLTITEMGGPVHAFWVWARTDADGKTRVSRAAWDACMKAANVTRGHCIKIG